MDNDVKRSQTVEGYCTVYSTHVQYSDQVVLYTAPTRVLYSAYLEGPGNYCYVVLIQ
jgi:hypothetical protein